MADPDAGDGTFRWIVGALGTFIGTLVFWILKRSSDREDRDFAARDEWMKRLEGLPARLDALVVRMERVEKLDGDYHAIREEISAIKTEIAVIRGQVTR